jgi:ABC-type phosphate/phosphonate transport system permease subunit
MPPYVQPFRNSLLQVHKSTTANEENILRINLQCIQKNINHIEQVWQAYLETLNTSASITKTSWLTGTFGCK